MQDWGLDRKQRNRIEQRTQKQTNLYIDIQYIKKGTRSICGSAEKNGLLENVAGMICNPWIKSKNQKKTGISFFITQI